MKISDNSILYIVEDYLKSNGFDGLFNTLGKCACLTGRLSPDNCMMEECVAGWRWTDKRKAEQAGLDWSYDSPWIIANVKPEKAESSAD